MNAAERNLTKQVGKNIQMRRKKLALSQEQMAERIGVGQQSLSSMERGATAPKFERLPVIAETLNCSVADLFRISERDKEHFESIVSDLVNDLDAEEQMATLEVIARMAHVFRVHRQSDRA